MEIRKFIHAYLIGYVLKLLLSQMKRAQTVHFANILLWKETLIV